MAIKESNVGAIAEGGVSMIDWELAYRLGACISEVHTVEAQERAQLDRRTVRYRRERPRVDVEGRKFILVDDGLATGTTARVAIAALRRPAPVP